MIQPEVDPQFQKPQLRTANHRVAHSLKKLNSLGKTVDRYLAKAGDRIQLFVRKQELSDGKRIRPILDWSKAPSLPATKLAMEAGEIVHHLRTALDYLAFNLACWIRVGHSVARSSLSRIRLSRSGDRAATPV